MKRIVPKPESPKNVAYLEHQDFSDVITTYHSQVEILCFEKGQQRLLYDFDTNHPKGTNNHRAIVLTGKSFELPKTIRFKDQDPEDDANDLDDLETEHIVRHMMSEGFTPIIFENLVEYTNWVKNLDV